MSFQNDRRPFTLRILPVNSKAAAADALQRAAPKADTPWRTAVWSLPAAIALGAFVLLLATGRISFGAIAAALPADVLAILITLDIFSLYVVQTGALDAVGLKLALATKGRPDLAAIVMGLLMFVSSALLNNLAAIFILGPILLTLLRAMRAPPPVTAAFLSLMLVLCNIGGMATPMGDFPAIMLMSSGLIGFTPYLAGAFPLAASLALIAILSYARVIGRQHAALSGPDEASRTRIHLELMRVRSRHVRPDLLRAILLSVVFVGMILVWALVPPDNWPFYMTAIVGAAAATLVAGPRLSVEALSNYDLRTTVTMLVILTGAALVSVSGLVGLAANALVVMSPNETLLLLALMAVVAVAAGLFSAGPATAAVLPIFVTLSHGPLASYGDLVGIAFAASICAGSSMFLHSATAGPALRGEALKAEILNVRANPVWGASSYLRFGAVTGFLQLGLSMAWILVAASTEASWVIDLVPIGLLFVVAGTISRMACPIGVRRWRIFSRVVTVAGVTLILGASAFGGVQVLLNT